MRIDDLERLVTAHATLMQSMAPCFKADGEIGYSFTKSRDAAEAIADTIKLALTTKAEIADPAPLF